MAKINDYVQRISVFSIRTIYVILNVFFFLNYSTNLIFRGFFRDQKNL
jgi:hypothetical protein